MIIAEPVLADRMPVWEALSEFYLDAELADGDYERIAGTLAVSPYAEEELDDILRYEVHPPCRWNLLSLTSAWPLFSREYLIAEVAPRYGRRPWLRLPTLGARIYRSHWRRVRRMVIASRSKNACGRQPASAEDRSDASAL